MRHTFGQSILGAALAGLVLGAIAQPASAIEISKHGRDTAEVNAIQLKGRIEEGDTFELVRMDQRPALVTRAFCLKNKLSAGHCRACPGNP